MKSIIIFLLLFTSSDLIACSCGTLSKINEETISKAKDIFIGRVINIEENDHRSRKVTFQIIERLKTIETSQIVVFTGRGGADCGLNIQVGQEWYIFANGYTGNSWTGLCDRSALLSKHSIPPNPYSKKYYRQAVRQYYKNKSRAKREIEYIRKTRLVRF